MKPLVEVLTATTAWFKERGIPSARLDAELLLGHVLGLDRVGVYLKFDRPFAEDELERLRPLVRRRGAREPLAWVLGHKEFYGREFIVTPGVLVPRPDTETLIEAALEWIPQREPIEQDPEQLGGGVTGGAQPPLSQDDPVYVADIGAGTGCVGITLALERPFVRVFEVDREEAPLAATRSNVARHQLEKRVAVLRGDLLNAVPKARTIDWVVSNPPYVPAATIATLAPEVSEHEPRAALDGGDDGLAVYRRLVPQCTRARCGALLEVGAGQSAAVAALLTASGFVDVRVWKDLAGVERVVGGRR